MAKRSNGRPFLTCDCETDPFRVGRVPRPFVWGLYDGEAEEYQEFKTVDEMLDCVRERDCVIYAHNGGKFDYHYMREHINTDEEIMVINGRLAKFKVGRAEFRDSINILPVPLRAFAKDEIDYALLEADRRNDPNVWAIISKYLRSDCVNLWEFIRQFREQYGKGLTQAGSAMRYWKNHFAVSIPQQTPMQFARYKPFYYGGRVQCFETGYQSTAFEVVDINSSYPYAMQFNHAYCVSGIDEDTRLPPVDEMGRYFFKVMGVSKGALPWRDPASNKLYFPDDERQIREYSVTGWELAAALEHDAFTPHVVKEVHRFPETVNFKDYVRHFYDMRKAAKAKGDKAGDVFAKLLMNSLYGKFGSDPTNYEQWVIASEDKYGAWCYQGYERHMTVGAGRFLMRRPLPEEKHRYYNICTAASVTGFARAHLFRALQKSGGVIYCDTDSIAARDVSAIDIGPNLGQWKREKRCDAFAVAGRKLYAFRDASAVPECDGKSTKADKFGRVWKVASKGVNLSPDQIISAAKGGKVLYTPEVPTYSILRQEPVFINRQVKRTEEAFHHD